MVLIDFGRFFDFGGWVHGLIGVALGAGCGLIGVIQRWVWVD